MDVVAAWENGQPAPHYPTLGMTFDVHNSPGTQLYINAPDKALLIEDIANEKRLEEPIPDDVPGATRTSGISAAAAVQRRELAGVDWLRVDASAPFHRE